MALLAVPFAFRIGRRGTLAGIGVGLFLGILALIATAFSTKLGEAGALPPLLAAWSPNVLFGTRGDVLPGPHADLAFPPGRGAGVGLGPLFPGAHVL